MFPLSLEPGVEVGRNSARLPLVLKKAVNVFWFAFAADGLLSLADEYLSRQNGFSSITVLRGVLALLVLVYSLFMAVLLVVTPRVPSRLVLPLIVFLWWAGAAFAFPLGRLDIPNLETWIALAQVALAGLAWVLFRQRRDNGLPFDLNNAPAFAWRHSLVAVPAMGVVWLLCATAAIFSWLATEVETSTGGYVRLHPDGIYLVERQFQSNGNEVRLAGMVHVAREEFYSGVLPKADPAMPAVVLVEGVTDHKRLLGEGSLKYANVARALNITSQENSVFTDRVVSGLKREKTDSADGSAKNEPSDVSAIRFKHADVDVESFHPQTITFIVAVMGLFQSRDLPSALRALVDPASPLGDSKIQTQAMQDILYARNQRLVSEIEISLKDYRRVIVPWGALHLPGVESWLREKEFVQSGEIERKAVGFW